MQMTDTDHILDALTELTSAGVTELRVTPEFAVGYARVLHQRMLDSTGVYLTWCAPYRADAEILEVLETCHTPYFRSCKIKLDKQFK